MTLPLALIMLIAGGQTAVTPDTPEAHLGNGYEALKQDRYDVAASEFRAALRIDPKLTMRARFPLAVALFEMKQSAEARREFEAVRAEVGDHPNICYYLGRLDLLDQNFEGAIRSLTRAAEKPPFPDTAYYLGVAYFKHGDLASAEKWLKQAEQIDPNSSSVPYQLSQLYRKEGHEAEANNAAARSAQLRQRDSGESQLKVECAKKLADAPFSEARSICEQLADPNNSEKLTVLGTLYGQHGYLEAALEPLRRAAELSPQSPQMQYNLAFTYYRLNRFEEARTPIAAAVERWPDLFPLNALYGAVLSKLGEDRPAYQALHRAHELNQQDVTTANLLYVTTLTLAGKSEVARRYSDSVRYFREAAKLRPGDPEPHRGLAKIYSLMGRSVEADAEQEEAKRLEKESR